MMKLFPVCLLLVLLVPASQAGLDPDPDSMGIYFDTAGHSNFLNTPMFYPFNAYLLLANPTALTTGFACTITLEGSPHFILSTTLAGGGVDQDASAGGYMVSLEQPYPVSNGHIVLATFSIIVQSVQALHFRLGPTLSGPPQPTACPRPIVWGNGDTRCCGVSSGDVILPVASVNSDWWPISDEPRSLGAVKALYR